MAYDSRVYRILIASPSDVQEERDAAVGVMQDWNNLHSPTRRVVVLPLRWETHTAPEFNVRPQEAINRRIVDDCDLVVGVFWTKLGTPTGVAGSGTLEEIERVAKAGKPVMLYFSHVPIDPNSVEHEQMERLRSFKEEISEHALIENFASALDFRDKFARQLELKIRDLQDNDSTEQPPPLNLQFLCLQTGELEGSSLAGSIELPEPPNSDACVDDGLKQYVEQLAEDARAKAAVVPVVLTIKNNGSSGIRNVYVEMVIRILAGALDVSDSDPTRAYLPLATTYWPGASSLAGFWSGVAEQSELEQTLERLSGKGLVRDGDEWKYSFEWEALQPQRVRLVQPVTYLHVSEACRAEFVAKVYADSFASPILLRAEVAIDVQRREIPMETVVAEARKLMEADKQASSSASSSVSRSSE